MRRATVRWQQDFPTNHGEVGDGEVGGDDDQRLPADLLHDLAHRARAMRGQQDREQGDPEGQQSASPGR